MKRSLFALLAFSILLASKNGSAARVGKAGAKEERTTKRSEKAAGRGSAHNTDSSSGEKLRTAAKIEDVEAPARLDKAAAHTQLIFEQLERANFSEIWTDIKAGKEVARWMGFSDREVLRFKQEYTFVANDLGQATPATKLALLRVVARIAELVSSTEPAWKDTVTVAELNKVTWPETEESARVLRRAAKALGIKPSEIEFAETTLNRFKPSMLKNRVAAEPAAQLAGADKTNVNELFVRMWRGEPVAKELALTDTTVSAFLNANFLVDGKVVVDESYMRSFSPETRVALARVYARFAETGGTVAIEPAQFDKLNLPANVEAAAVLKRLAKALHLNTRKIQFAGQTLAKFVARKEQRQAAPETLTQVLQKLSAHGFTVADGITVEALNQISWPASAATALHLLASEYGLDANQIRVDGTLLSELQVNTPASGSAPETQQPSL